MSKELYNSVSSYTQYKQIIEASEAKITEGSSFNCNTTIFTEGCDDKSFLRNCLIAKNYLTLIKEHRPPFNIEHACKYLSYWTYQEVVKDSKYSYNVSTFLKKIMETEYIDVCTRYTENISKEVFSKVQSLIALYKCLGDLPTSENEAEEVEEVDEVEEVEVKKEVEVKEEDACQSNKKCVELYQNFKNTCDLNNDKHLCNEVENFRRTYYNIMYKTGKCNEYKYLPSYQKHSEVSSITTSIVALSAVSFVSFISYKFTPFGSWIRNGISGGNNLMNKIEKENKEARYTSGKQDIPYSVGYHSSR